MSSDSSSPEPRSQNAGKPQKLSAAEASQFATAIADLANLGLPLASGLRALANESRGTTLASALNSLAAQIEAGVPLEEALQKLGVQFPEHIRGLIAVGMRTGNLGETLTDFAERQREMRVVHRQIWQVLLYPLFLFLFSLPILGFLLFVLVPQMRETLWFGDMMYLPSVTQFLLQIVDQGPKVALIVLGVSSAVCITGLLVGGTRFWDALMRSFPLWGPTFTWSRVANFSQVLGTLLKHHIPLPEALRYTSEAVPGLGLRKESRLLADAVDRGGLLSSAVEKTQQFPALLPAFIEWGERSDSVPEALDAAGEYAGQQVDIHAERIRLVVPVMIFTGVAFLVGMIVAAILLPLFSGIKSLTW